VRDALARVAWRPNLHLPHWLRLSRYTVGSLICFLISETVFIATFGSHLLGARTASVVASIAGIIPGYLLNRTWTWGRRHRSDFWREIVPYWAIAFSGALFAALATGAANAAVMSEPRATRTVINALVYMATYGVLFVGKYAIFQKWLFAPPAEAAEFIDLDAPPAESRQVATEPRPPYPGARSRHSRRDVRAITSK
jgi:putative flippase GtrA